MLENLSAEAWAADLSAGANRGRGPVPPKREAPWRRLGKSNREKANPKSQIPRLRQATARQGKTNTKDPAAETCPGAVTTPTLPSYGTRQAPSLRHPDWSTGAFGGPGRTPAPLPPSARRRQTSHSPRAIRPSSDR